MSGVRGGRSPIRASLVLTASERPLYALVFPQGFPILVIPQDRNML